MADVLARIVERKRGEVAARLPDPVAAVPTHRSLKAALARPGARFIMEVKRKSPSGHVGKHSVEQAVAAYAPIADAISVLTDGADFGGSLDDLRFVRERFDGPILAKDFVVHPNQVGEAREAGADAVLVMMSVLDDRGAADVLAAARRLAMDAIVEVHDEAELARALDLGAEIVGINNRDLKSLTIDLAVTERLAAMVPEGVLLISESGIATRGDVERLARHVDAFLVGSSLMAADDIGEAARALVYGRVKICGLTRTDDIDRVAAAGATHAGVIMVPGTPRDVDVDRAPSLAAAAKRQGLKAVGVFRDRPNEEIAALARSLDLDAVQLHGNEDDDAIADLRTRLRDATEIWTVRSIEDGIVAGRRGGDRTLFDTKAGGQAGGTGQPFDWSLIAGDDDVGSAVIAGGIGPDNAASAQRIGTYAIDVSSGVESAPGIKDDDKLRALFAALRVKTKGDK